MKPERSEQDKLVHKIDLWFFCGFGGVCIVLLALLLGSLQINTYMQPLQSMPERVMDTVVHIRALDKDAPTWDYDSEYDYLFGQSWQGSGCFVSPDGVIMTAGHVVDGAEEITVTLRDGTTYQGKYFWKADNMDVGFIKIDLKTPNYLQFDPDGVELAEDIYVIGHPYGTDHPWNITKGIVSNLKRDCGGFFGEKLMIQVDAASYPGNSGGPVIDMDGEIIGVLVGGYGPNECISYITPTWIAKEWYDVFIQWLETR